MCYLPNGSLWPQKGSMEFLGMAQKAFTGSHKLSFPSSLFLSNHIRSVMFFVMLCTFSIAYVVPFHWNVFLCLPSLPGKHLLQAICYFSCDPSPWAWQPSTSTQFTHTHTDHGFRSSLFTSLSTRGWAHKELRCLGQRLAHNSHSNFDPGFTV